jgi:Na+/H+-dicarboxylate symporter
MKWLRRISLTQWILFSMVAGVVLGVVAPEFSQGLRMISNVFLRLIKCILVPLVLSTLIVGIAGHSDDLKAVGRLAFKALIYFEAVTTVALVIGLSRGKHHEARRWRKAAAARFGARQDHRNQDYVPGHRRTPRSEKLLRGRR